MTGGWKLTLIALGLLLATAAVPAAAAEPPTADATRSVEVYPAGDKFVVAVYRPDGGVILSLVEAPGLDMTRQSAPDMDELIRRGRVTYTVRLSPGDGAAPSDLAARLKPRTASGGAARHPVDRRRAALIRQRLKDFRLRVATAVTAMTRIGEVLNARAKSDTPPLPAAAAPPSDAAK